MTRIGAWIVGARGSVATTAQVGAAAIAAGAARSTGMVTALPAFEGAPLAPVDEIVFGGHDIAGVSLVKRAEALSLGGVIPGGLLDVVHDQLKAADARIKRGVEGDEPERAAIERLTGDIESFRAANDLDVVTVVHLASVEGAPAPHPAHASLPALEAALTAGERVLPPSSLYAYAAIEAGCSYVNFTPSTGIQLPALKELAAARGTAWSGRDGKTGETLVKVALAPLFATRNLRVRSWSGSNLLGGGDGAVLADPARAQAKVAAKGAALPAILGYAPEAPVEITYVEDLGEWKTAWDNIRFDGFLGVGMTMQFTWQGCDSTLAAPLVLDLVRLTAAAQRSGASGLLDALAYFYKDPADATEHGLEAQYARLLHWAGSTLRG